MKLYLTRALKKLKITEAEKWNASAVRARVLLKIELSHKTGIVLKILGVVGLLDLPLCVFLPQIGLPHWIILGGDTAEPLIETREMGVLGPIFFLGVLLVTFGLALLYFKPFGKALSDKLEFYSKVLEPEDVKKHIGYFHLFFVS